MIPEAISDKPVRLRLTLLPTLATDFVLPMESLTGDGEAGYPGADDASEIEFGSLGLEVDDSELPSSGSARCSPSVLVCL